MSDFPVPEKKSVEATELYRAMVRVRLISVNPYYDDELDLSRDLYHAASLLRDMADHEEQSPEWWRRYAVALLSLSDAILNKGGGEALTNVCTDLRWLAGIEPAVPPYRKPDEEETL